VCDLFVSYAELTLPERGNVFYAVNTSVPEIQFVVRRKQQQPAAANSSPLSQAAHHQRGHSATSQTMWKRLSSFT